MANLKADLLNELNNQKYYSEMELLRLAQDPNMNYKIKIGLIIDELGKISGLNQKIGLADGYFQVPEQQVQDQGVPAQGVPQAPQDGPIETALPEAPVEKAPAPAPVQPLPGQSHAE